MNCVTVDKSEFIKQNGAVNIQSTMNSRIFEVCSVFSHILTDFVYEEDLANTVESDLFEDESLSGLCAISTYVLAKFLYEKYALDVKINVSSTPNDGSHVSFEHEGVGYDVTALQFPMVYCDDNASDSQSLPKILITDDEWRKSDGQRIYADIYNSFKFSDTMAVNNEFAHWDDSVSPYYNKEAVEWLSSKLKSAIQ